MILDKWSLSKPPPEGDPDVGKYVFAIYEMSKAWKDSLDLETNWDENHRALRARHWLNKDGSSDDSNKININLAGANILRTAANLVASDPVFAVMSMDGLDESPIDDKKDVSTEDKFNALAKNWWAEREMLRKLHFQVTQGETYAISFARFIRRADGDGDIRSPDPYSMFFEEGNWDDLSTDPTYVIEKVPVSIDKLKDKYGKNLKPGQEIKADTVFTALGEHRQHDRPDTRQSVRVFDRRVEGYNNPISSSGRGKSGRESRLERASVYDCWIRDYSTEKKTYRLDEIKTPAPEIKPAPPVVDPRPLDSDGKPEGPEPPGYIHPITKAPLLTFQADPFDGIKYPDSLHADAVTLQFHSDTKTKLPGGISVEYAEDKNGKNQRLTLTRHIYPGGIRNILVTNNGDVVLADLKNPLIHQGRLRMHTEHTYAYDRFPFWFRVSCPDSASMWGYSHLEQVWDIQLQIDEMVSKILRYSKREVWPTLLIPHGATVHRKKLSNNEVTVVRCPPQFIRDIRYISMPPVSNTYMSVLNLLMTLFDRVFQIEGVDRGEMPYSGMAMGTVQALQSRNATLVGYKIASVNYMVREMGRHYISFQQNFGIHEKTISVGEDFAVIRPSDHIHRKLTFSVEPGSTYQKTPINEKQEIMQMFQVGLIRQKWALKMLKVENWKEISEELGEGQLGNAMAVLIQAGLPEEDAKQLYDTLMADQGGPGDTAQTPRPPGGPAPVPRPSIQAVPGGPG